MLAMAFILENGQTRVKSINHISFVTFDYGLKGRSIFNALPANIKSLLIPSYGLEWHNLLKMNIHSVVSAIPKTITKLTIEYSECARLTRQDFIRILSSLRADLSIDLTPYKIPVDPAETDNKQISSEFKPAYITTGSQAVILDQLRPFTSPLPDVENESELYKAFDNTLENKLEIFTAICREKHKKIFNRVREVTPDFDSITGLPNLVLQYIEPSFNFFRDQPLTKKIDEAKALQITTVQKIPEQKTI